MKICLLDPGIENNIGQPSSNLGDLIIQEAVERELNKIFGSKNFIKFSTHAALTKQEIELIRNDCFLTLVGGSNLLSSNMNEYRQWKIGLKTAFQLKKAILLGVGWWQYQDSPNLYTQILLKTTLARKGIHSVRDSYTKDKLQQIGIKNVLNTGCPTMWQLAAIHPENFPVAKSDNILLMLTDYNKDIQLDKKMLKLLFSKYEKIYFWPQGRHDAKYISELISELKSPVIILEESLASLDQFIHSGISFDYIGTRLHGGIKCLCAKKRALILEIDNRAKEIARDTQLPTTERANLEYISKWIDGSSFPNIKLDLAAIEQWKNQFLNLIKIDSQVENCLVKN
ncbi:polysaccharide pyruvyl transferase family protein [Tolypothrix campylonemoides VB511288]|nr:polysaccharide pyruvyl transferase family protein [Tolypothrix campylonemoides VB511288]